MRCKVWSNVITVIMSHCDKRDVMSRCHEWHLVTHFPWQCDVLLLVTDVTPSSLQRQCSNLLAQWHNSILIITCRASFTLATTTNSPMVTYCNNARSHDTVTHYDIVTHSHTCHTQWHTVSHSVAESCVAVPPPMQGICKLHGYVVVSQDCNQMYTRLSWHTPITHGILTAWLHPVRMSVGIKHAYWNALCHSMWSGSSQHRWHHRYEEIAAISKYKCVVSPISRTKPYFRLLLTRNGSWELTWSYGQILSQ